MMGNLQGGLGFRPGFGQQPDPAPEPSSEQQPPQSVDAVADDADGPYRPAPRVAAPSPAGPSTVSVTCGSAFPRCLWDSLDLRYREHSERKRLQIEYLESFF